MNRIGKQIQRVTRQIDREIGLRAVYNTRTLGAFDPIAGTQTVTEAKSNVRVRLYPLSFRDLTELSRAGLDQVEARFSMLESYIDSVEPRHQIEIKEPGHPLNGDTYEVLESPSATLDEFGVEWTIFTRKVRS